MAKARMLGYQKTGATNAKAAPPYWAVKRGAETLCHGSRETFPGPAVRKTLKRDGYRLQVEGRIWKEDIDAESYCNHGPTDP